MTEAVKFPLEMSRMLHDGPIVISLDELALLLVSMVVVRKLETSFWRW